MVRLLECSERSRGGASYGLLPSHEGGNLWVRWSYDLNLGLNATLVFCHVAYVQGQLAVWQCETALIHHITWMHVLMHDGSQVQIAVKAATGFSGVTPDASPFSSQYGRLRIAEKSPIST